MMFFKFVREFPFKRMWEIKHNRLFIKHICNVFFIKTYRTWKYIIENINKDPKIDSQDYITEY